MSIEHDFENARRGAVIKGTGKTRVTMYLDDDVIDFFRELATAKGRGYQTEINAALRTVMAGGKEAGSGLQDQMSELVRAVGRVERAVTARGRYVEHRAGERAFVREKKSAQKPKGKESGTGARRAS